MYRIKNNNMILKNINWESETELANINECDDLIYSETDFNITFEYNGIKLFATVDFLINLYQCGEEETNSISLEVLDTDVYISQILDEDDLEFHLTAKQEIELTKQLAIELKIEF